VKWLFEWMKPSLGSSKPAEKHNGVQSMHTSTWIHRICNNFIGFRACSKGGRGGLHCTEKNRERGIRERPQQREWWRMSTGRSRPRRRSVEARRR
jgi:hypothetical protein